MIHHPKIEQHSLLRFMEGDASLPLYGAVEGVLVPALTGLRITYTGNKSMVDRESEKKILDPGLPGLIAPSPTVLSLCGDSMIH